MLYESRVGAPADDAGEVEAGRFPNVGNHPCLDFVNTLPNREGSPLELLVSVSDLVRWLSEMSLVTAEDLGRIGAWSDAETDGVTGDARALRGHLRHAVSDLADGRGVDDSIVDDLDRRLASVSIERRLQRDKEAPQGMAVTERPRIVTPGDLLAPILMAAADLLARCRADRIRRCEHPQCVLFFYDTSRNGARRWCTMATCGNRLKASRHYQRQRRGLDRPRR